MNSEFTIKVQCNLNTNISLTGSGNVSVMLPVCRRKMNAALWWRLCFLAFYYDWVVGGYISSILMLIDL